MPEAMQASECTDVIIIIFYRRCALLGCAYVLWLCCDASAMFPMQLACSMLT